MDLIFTARITSPEIPDPEQVANIIPAAFAQLVGGDATNIIVQSVQINVVPVVFQAPMPDNVPAPAGADPAPVVTQ